MKQMSLASSGFELKSKRTRKCEFLDEMELVVPWAEHPFRVIKRQFGHVKVRYRGLKKNTQQLYTLFALSNLWMVRRTLLQGVRG